MTEKTKSFSFRGWLNSILLLCLTIVCFLNYRALHDLTDMHESSGEGERISLLAEMATERRGLQTEIKELREQLDSAESALGKDQKSTEHLMTSYRKAQAQAGLSKVEGPGVVIRLADSNQPVPPDADPYYFIVHDSNLQALVNELWAAGAEAIALNGHRLVYRSSIRCIGPTVLVNNQRLASPYVVEAIGPSKELSQALRLPGGFMNYMSPFLGNGVSISVDQSNMIHLAEFSGELLFDYAKVPGDEKDQQAEAAQKKTDLIN